MLHTRAIQDSKTPVFGKRYTCWRQQSLIAPFINMALTCLVTKPVYNLISIEDDVTLEHSDSEGISGSAEELKGKGGLLTSSPFPSNI